MLLAGTSTASRNGVGRATLTLRCAGAAAAVLEAVGCSPAPSALPSGSNGLSSSATSWADCGCCGFKGILGTAWERPRLMCRFPAKLFLK